MGPQKVKERFPPFIWRIMRQLSRLMMRTYGAKSPAARFVLLLTTTGRKSGLPRTTPLQFEESEGMYYVASARGVQADWYRNLLKEPQVLVQVKDRRFSARAMPITDPERIADFLQLRLERRPRFMGVMMRLEGLPFKYGRPDLVEVAHRLAAVALHQSE
jgi:deazaflavin-dependent oxidoreductase (nitroreductase family)